MHIRVYLAALLILVSVAVLAVLKSDTSVHDVATKVKQFPFVYQKRKLLEASDSKPITLGQQTRSITVFEAFRDSPFARKQRESLLDQESGMILVSNTTEQQHAFLVENPCVAGAPERFEALLKSNFTHLAEELWKYCALFVNGGLYLDAESPVLKISTLKRLLQEGISHDDSNADANFGGMAVLMDSFAPKAISGTLLFLQQPKSRVVSEMAKMLVTTDISILATSPLLLPRTLHDLILAEAWNGTNTEIDNEARNVLQPGKCGTWYMLRQACSENPFRRNEGVIDSIQLDSVHAAHSCSRSSGLCCMIYGGDSHDGNQYTTAILGSNKPIQPIQLISYKDLPKPFRENGPESKHDISSLEILPYVSTVRIVDSSEDKTGSQQTNSFLTFYEKLKSKDCLPSHSCNKCLSDKKHGATCDTCLEACPCFCKELCQPQNENDSPKYQDVLVRRPSHTRDPTRLIPRIVHQTWFEKLDPDKYPNMSRLTESFKTSGWEYQFYTDDQAGAFLSEHFPPQVVEAYNLLIPGAFKADLFRYCVLLVRGGVYADVDVLMGPSLDDAIPNDVGFMVGLDEPGKKQGKRMCLWNGFIASAPGHPFLAKVVENVVNNIHQRFTSVDMARLNCPSPEMSIITSFCTLFVAGPCMLGFSINNVLGRHAQTQFEAGELSHSNVGIPGRTIILNQSKGDMGAHRFTFQEQNLIVLSTDFPDSDDREGLEDYEHYSKTRVKFTTYGIDGVYKNSDRNKNALIRISLE